MDRMITREDLISQLLRTSHLNSFSRRVFKDQPIHFNELLAAANKYFQSGKFLPEIIKDWSDTKLCYEGWCLEKVEFPETKYAIHLQSAGPFLDLKHSSTILFMELGSALYQFILREFQFNIDGIPITPP